MNITTSDKKSIKNFITAYLSIKAVAAIVIICIMVVFGTMVIKSANKVRTAVNAQFSHSEMS